MSFAELFSQQPFVPYVRFADYAVREAGWFLPHRRLLDYLFVYVQEGSCEIEVGGRSHVFRAGDFCLIQPDEPCMLRGLTNTITPYAHFDLFYNPLREASFMTLPGQTDISGHRQFLQPRLNDVTDLAIPAQFQLQQRSVYRESLLKLIGLWQNGDALGRLEANHLLGEMMIGLLKTYGGPPQINPAHKPQSLNWIASYLSYSLSEPLSLEDMARRARLSPSRFAALFKAKFGVSPHRYLLNLRIRHAQELIRKGEYSLEEIALYCGFADASHFSKAFRKATGETPGAYRKQSDSSL